MSAASPAHFGPQHENQVREAVAWAAAEGVPLAVRGRGSKEGIGRPVQAGATLDLSSLSGILLYEPEELVLSAAAGTSLAEVQAALDDRAQQLAFEPFRPQALLGAADAGSLGGCLAVNLAGPRRPQAGAARDHFLGARAVSGRGEAFKTGGRVVKNVTGYDLCKLLAGSFGTLAVMTTVTVKVLPRPKKTRTLLLFGQPVEAAGAAMRRAMGAPLDVSAAAWLPAGLAAGCGVDRAAAPGTAVTALRLEGTAISVAERCAALRRLLGGGAEMEELHSHNSAAFWAAVRDAAPLAAPAERPVWRIALPPTGGPSFLAAAEAEGLLGDGAAFLDWAGGLVWLAAAASAADGHAAALRRLLQAHGGGHATLLRGPEALRLAVPVFQPQAPGLAALAERIRAGMDPQGVLNPGRLAADPPGAGG
ncbi:glycolate oxidase subunit GlcE [Marinibaculum pumilum]|uniref:Glycolate oxidase subunit GlcE n=1 Tax=Marinibaculum pumilum TaxID=1766165 RepID=A0ABV7L6F4_9PROT